MIISCMVGISVTASAESPLTTITATGKEQASYSTANVATVSFSYTAGGSSAYLANWGWWGYGWTATVTPAEGYTITKCIFYDDANRTATDSEAPFVVETTEEDKTPRINGTPIDGGNMQSKGITKIEVYGYTASAHDHSFTYSVNGATITATCTGDGDCDYKTTGITLTLNAPTKTTYGDTGSASATITGYPTTAITNLAATPTTVTYYNSTGEGSTTTSGSALAAAPEDAGNYVAQFTWGGETVSKAYSIAKADPTAPTGLTATYGQTLADVTLPTGWTWADSTQSVGNVVSPAATFKANFAGNDNYNAASNVDVTVTVGKAANPATVTGTASVTTGGKTVDLSANVTKKGATGNVTYAISGSDLGCSVNASTGVFTSGTTAGTVTVNVTIAEDDNYNALAATPITVTISDKAAQTITASDVTATYGTTGNKVNATLTTGDGTLSYAVTAGDDVVTINATSGALTILKAGSAVITVTATETDNYAAATKDITVTINKADPTAPSGLTAKTGQTLADVTLPDGWSWVDNTKDVGAVGENKFKANYTPTGTDATNYNSKTDVELTVTVKAKPAETYSVTVVGGTSDKATAEAGATVTITATIPDGKEFVNWTTSDVEGLNGSTAATTTFTMPAKAVTVTANFKDKSSGGGQGGGGYTPFIPSYTTTTTTTTTNTGKLDNTTDEKKNDNGASLESSNDELSKAVLTDADRAAMAKGENIQVYLEVEEKKPTKAEQQKAEEALAKIDESGEIAMYMDMNLFKKVGSNAPVQIHEVNGKVEVGFKVPEKFINNDPDTQRTFYIGHIKDDGTVEIIKCEFDPETGIATFYTDSFSCYFLIFEDAPAAANTSVEETDDDEDTDTDTGDDFDELTDDSDDDDDEGDFDDDFAEDQTDGDSDTDNDDQAAVDAVVDNGETNPNTGAPFAGMGVFAVMSFFAAAAAYTAKKRKNK